jgi:excisionase family DNA binding protein
MNDNNKPSELTVSEIAEIMQTTAPRVVRLVQTSGLPASYYRGELRFNLESVTDWMNRRSMAIAPREPRRRSLKAAPFSASSRMELR